MPPGGRGAGSCWLRAGLFFCKYSTAKSPWCQTWMRGIGNKGVSYQVIADAYNAGIFWLGPYRLCCDSGSSRFD